ncbi:MAG TPA: hypothetical protein VJ461_02250 [Candidatus Nanoarchaeia archaeon]|nr:hypothetical protein [Candidatus Nanoarchaeia archaeon]
MNSKEKSGVLESIISSSKNFAKENKRFLIGSALLIGSAAADYYLTNLNLSNKVYGEVAEGSPFINQFIDYYGNTAGLLIPKVGITGIVMGVSYQMNRVSHKFKKLRGEHLLYAGTILNSIMAAGSLVNYFI